MRREPVPRVFWSHLFTAALLVGAACTTTPEFCAADPAEPASFTASLRVVDESGAPIAGAAAIMDGVSIAGAGDGTIVLPALDGPVMLVVTAPGHFSEPVPVGASDDGQRLTIKLWAEGGERFVMHSAGDVMFGRRYEAPTTGDALIPVDDVVAGAEFVVDPVSAAFRVADFRTVNLETVVSDRGASAGYPGKRFIVRSRPDTLAALVKLGVDVASQANNHSRDYLDVGIVDTVAALKAHHLPVVGVSSGPDAPAITAITAVRGARVAVMAFTTVDGSTVNDAYPDQDEPRPSDVKPEEAWLYQDREWGFVGGVVSVPEASRRIGAAWLLFEDLEPKAGDDLGAMWGSISAVYPEMQDWVARRGHGGAALWDPVASAAEVAALKADDHLVVLQLHAGYEFQDSPSDNVRAIAREAIDAGADIVIGHHPHVLQGLEIYKGRLIAYSMGNFIFDQDFLATLASGFLRTVWDGDTLLEARLVPLEISDYRPLPVVGAAARQNLFRVWERSLLGGGASKDELGLVHTFPITLDADTVPAQLIVEHNTARLVATPPAPTTVELTVPAHGMVPLPFDGLVAARLGRAPAASDTVWVGKDLFGWPLRG